MTDLVTERALARTDGGGSYPDARKAVEQYREATRYASKRDAGSGATASALGLPRSRIRTWVDGNGASDSVRTIDIDAHRELPPSSSVPVRGERSNANVSR